MNPNCDHHLIIRIGGKCKYCHVEFPNPFKKSEAPMFANEIVKIFAVEQGVQRLGFSPHLTAEQAMEVVKITEEVREKFKDLPATGESFLELDNALIERLKTLPWLWRKE